MFAQVYPRIIDTVGEWNPQLFREIKGRLKPKSIAMVALASSIGQFLLYWYFKGTLTLKEGSYSRYCTSSIDEYSNYRICQTDLLGNLQIIKELWWLDLFTTISVMGVFILLVVGSYMLIADVSKENSKNTLNFIRLTPQSALTIFAGKMLGVPILVYLFGLLAIPLHLLAGLKASIPLPLILGFYGVLIASCIFFYSASLLFTLVSSNLGNFQAWLGSMIIFFYLFTAVSFSMEVNEWSNTSFDWLILFNPAVFLIYLVKSTFISPTTINYFSFDGIYHLNWYGNFWWRNAVIGFSFMVANYGIWSFCLWQGIKRRFHNPLDTVISKYQSYLISACFIVFNLGFTLQQSFTFQDDEGLIILQVTNFFFFLLLIPMITPDRQNLQDWARYRHINSLSPNNIFRDLLLGEKSPSPLSIIVNLGIVNLYVIPSLLIFSFEQNDRLLTIIGFLFASTMIVIYGIIFQLLLMIKNQKRNLIASVVVSSLIFSPFLTLIVLNQSQGELPIVWLFSAFPLVAMDYSNTLMVIASFITQVIIIIGANYQLSKVLNQAGISETKTLLAN